jgi:hypothetical protein
LSLWLGLTASVFAAETLTLTLTDGASVTGDIVKSDDYAVMIHTAGETYTTTTIQWPRFSQDSLKQLAKIPSLQAYVGPFIEPTESTRPQKAAIQVKAVTRLNRPENPSIFGGLVHSSVGWFILLVVYAANLYAAFEIALVRGKPPGMVIGLSAVLPLIGPIFFLTQSIKPLPVADEPAGEAVAAVAPPVSPAEEVPMASTTWQPSSEEKKPQPQVFARGKFTFNKRFIETKFAGFVGELKGEAKTFTMEIKTLKALFAVERIMQVGTIEMILETPNGQVTVPFADIQEIKLNPKPV